MKTKIRMQINGGYQISKIQKYILNKGSKINTSRKNMYISPKWTCK